ncbi:lysine exporter LysO family protein [Celerinatantimonas yamalensis]|uniref:Lysine exporter LysO family protein n=1 Tax=Celerinatantimonas yamalensis TaxID=559956 RepID=A0ABW9GA74_9GAMM
MLLNITFILAPLFIGYAISIKQTRLINWVNRACSKMIYLILTLMGYNLAFIDHLSANLTRLSMICGVFVGLVSLFNISALTMMHRYLVIPVNVSQSQKVRISPQMFKDSLFMVGLVAFGFIVGLIGHWHLPYQAQLSDYILMLLLALIGLQLRASELSLRQILLDHRGILIALTIIISTIPATLLAGWILDLPHPLALALGSGFGWYSLSGILISGQVNALMGSSAFFIDLFRELLAIFLIPLLMPFSAACAIGYGGATSMDFTLPIISRTGGARCVPVAIVSGFILSLACPALIAIWLSFYHP